MNLKQVINSMNQLWDVVRANFGRTLKLNQLWPCDHMTFQLGPFDWTLKHLHTPPSSPCVSTTPLCTETLVTAWPCITKTMWRPKGVEGCISLPAHHLTWYVFSSDFVKSFRSLPASSQVSVTRLSHVDLLSTTASPHQAHNYPYALVMAILDVLADIIPKPLEMLCVNCPFTFIIDRYNSFF